MPDQRVLLVEGKDDEHVVRHLYGNHNALSIYEMEECGGFQEILKSIRVRLKASNEKVIGVIVDADADPKARWQSLCSLFTQAGYPDAAVPLQPDPKGTIFYPPVESLLPRAGVWIMPDNKNSGALEDFLCFLVPKSDRLFPHATDSVDSIPCTERRFSESDTLKAIMHTWLAWQRKPGRPYGTAIDAGFLDPCVPQANALVSWLERLFREPK